MNALILGGMSPRHKAWVRQVAEVLQPYFDEVRPLDYRHWDAADTEMDLEYEISQADVLAKNFDEYVVVAKSIGTVLASFANARGLLAPQRCVFMGFPLKVAEAQFPEVANALPQLPPTVFLHNERDPLGSAAAVKQYVDAHAPKAYEFQVLPGDTHDYTDFDLIVQLAADV